MPKMLSLWIVDRKIERASKLVQAILRKIVQIFGTLKSRAYICLSVRFKHNIIRR
jgi:hypothetical protein